ncbi:MAG: HAD family hydrolase [Candidatus Dormibacteria bacterium]
MEPRPWRIAAFFDVDRTLVRGSSMLALAGPLWRAGLLPSRAVLSAAVRGLQFSAHGFDEQEIQRSVRSIGEAVRGMEVARLRRVAERAIPGVLGPRLYAEALELIAWHRDRGHLVFLVSASTHELIDKLGGIVGADGVVASEAEIVAGRYTGMVSLCHGTAKVDAVRRLAAAHRVDLDGSFAYGDGGGDIPMLQAVGHPTAVNADRGLRAAAERQGWRQLRFRSPDRWTWLTGPTPGWMATSPRGREVSWLTAASRRERVDALIASETAESAGTVAY